MWGIFRNKYTAFPRPVKISSSHKTKESPEIRDIYDELLAFISGKRLRQDERERLRKIHTQREQEAYYRAMSKGFGNVHAPENDSLWGWVGSLVVSTVSSTGAGYYDYQASKEEIRREIHSEQWQLTREEIESCNKLQTTLLNSSWSLLSKYHLPNEYRLTQENVREFLAVMNESDPSKRLGRLRFIERKFKVYPPYWFFRANAAMSAGNDEECRKSYAKFNEVWRPVLNYDPYKLEAVKQRIRELAKIGVPEGDTVNEIRGLAETLRDYAPPYDWGSNLFSGIVYFALGDKDEAINCVEYGNVASGRETEISGVILGQMKRGKIDVAKLPEELRGLFGKSEAQSLYEMAEKYREDEGFSERVKAYYFKSANLGYAPAQHMIGYQIYFTTALGDLSQEKFKLAVEWFRKAAEQEFIPAQRMLGFMYIVGYGVEKDKRKAREWYEKAGDDFDKMIREMNKINPKVQY